MTLIDALVVSLNLDATKFTAGQQQTNTALASMRDGAGKAAREMSATTKGMVDGFARVRTEVLGLLGLFAVTRGFKSITSDITQQDAALGRLSSRLGVSTQELAGWDGAAQSAGARAGEATGSIATMSAAFERFKLTGQGGDTFIPYLTRLGVHLRNTRGEMLSAGDQQLELARAFQAQDRTDPKATDFLGGQLPGMTQGMIDFLRRGPEFVQQRLDKQKAIGLPTQQDTRNAQDILEQLGYVDGRMRTFGRHLLNDVSPGITRVLTRLGDWLDKHLPGWYAKIDPIISGFMRKLDGLDFDRVATDVEHFGKRVWDAFSALANWQPPAWIAHLLGLDAAGGETGQPGQSGAQGSGGGLAGFFASHFGRNNYLPSGTMASDAMNEAATRNGVPVDFARKIFAIEKGVDADGKALISKAGAIGAGQLMPGTAKDLGVDPYNLQQNVDGSTRYMRTLLDRYHGNQAAAAAAYNAGPNNPAVQRFADTGDASGLPAETRDYVQQFGHHWFEADRSGRNAELKQLDHTGGFWDGFRNPPAQISVPPKPWVPAPTLEWHPVNSIAKLQDNGRDMPGDRTPEKPDLAGLQRLLSGDAAAAAANSAIPTAAQRWGSASVTSTEHHDNSSATTINGGVHVHTQAKDAKGIARDMDSALKARGMAAQSNRRLS